MMYPAQYWRNSKHWKNWIGKKGSVLAETVVHSAPPEYQKYCPYQIALITFKDQKKLFMVPPTQRVAVGDVVEVVLRKGPHTSQESIIEYELKVVPISLQESF